MWKILVGKKETCHILEMVLLIHFQKHVMKDKSYNKFYIPWHAIYFIHSVLNKNQVLLFGLILFWLLASFFTFFHLCLHTFK